ncbi:MAG: ABC-F family ATP-binding cassette domain-containing protein [Azospirillaceae bacterium]|nr:ABC-F family ATP-binding cassette domain-containing protein [Azospirillaceae bacterium]
MPATITLSDLSWSTPDGRPLFSHLSLTFGPVRTGLIGRNGAGKSTLLALMAGSLPPQAGAVAATGRLGVMRQAMPGEPDATVADLFGVTDALALLRRAEAGLATADDLAAADWTLEARLSSALARLRLDVAPETPLAALSGGQRTRAALAALLFAEPDFLLLDEPTNNLDRAGRQAVLDVLAGWTGGAVIASHDRELLGAVDAIVELTTLGATVYGGNWAHYRERRALDLAAAQHDLAEAEKRVADAARDAQESLERQARRDAAGRRHGAAGGMPRILLGRRQEQGERTGGANARLADDRRTQAAETVTAARARVEVLAPLSITLAPTGLPPHKTVLRLEGVTAGHEPGRPVIRDFSLNMTGPERIAVTGPNGAGKSTLLALVTGGLAPWAGQVRLLAPHVLLDQQAALLEAGATIRDNFRRLNPAEDENTCRAALARFRFRADAGLRTVAGLSGGERVRAGLACVLGGRATPPLLILDEPTNHLDIAAIEVMEAALRAYDGALLVVSHDDAFLEAIGITRRVALG